MDELLKACKQAMFYLTQETESEWRESQSYEDAPYYCIYIAIINAENAITAQIH